MPAEQGTTVADQGSSEQLQRLLDALVEHGVDAVALRYVLRTRELLKAADREMAALQTLLTGAPDVQTPPS
jgi:hypothetical protein